MSTLAWWWYSFFFCLVGSDASLVGLQTESPGGAAEKAGSNNTIQITPPSGPKRRRRHFQSGQGQCRYKPRTNNIWHRWHHRIGVRVLWRTDDQIHRQAFHWSAEIWGREIQLAVNKYFSSFRCETKCIVHWGDPFSGNRHSPDCLLVVPTAENLSSSLLSVFEDAGTIFALRMEVFSWEWT